MVERFSVVPVHWQEKAQTLDAVLRHAHADPSVLHLNPAPVHYLVFCASPAQAGEVRRRYKEGGTVETECATVEIDPRGLHVDQDCEPGSRRRQEAFLRWVFTTFAPCTVIDHDGERDLSLLATRNPDILFDR